MQNDPLKSGDLQSSGVLLGHFLGDVVKPLLDSEATPEVMRGALTKVVSEKLLLGDQKGTANDMIDFDRIVKMKNIM